MTNRQSDIDENFDRDYFASLAINIPPARWADLRRRIGAVQEFQRLQKPTKSDAIEAAAKLGLGVSSFYRLIQVFSSNGTQPAPSKPPGRSDYMDDRVERALSAILERLQHPTTQAVYKELIQACEEQGIPVPTENAIRQRLLRTPSSPDISKTIAGDVDFIIDSVETDIVIRSNDTASFGHLCAVFDLNTSLIETWILTPSKPNPTTFRLLLKQFSHENKLQTETVAGITEIPLPTRFHHLGNSDFPTVRVAARSFGKRSDVFRIVFGNRMGNISLYALPPRTRLPDISVAVKLDDARAICGRLIENRNSELRKEIS